MDKNCFLFSLDNQKIYFPKNDNYFKIDCYSYDGPSFSIGRFYIIKIDGNAITNKSLKTNEIDHKLHFDGNENALSEDGNFNGIYAKEYEVFEIKF